MTVMNQNYQTRQVQLLQGLQESLELLLFFTHGFLATPRQLSISWKPARALFARFGDTAANPWQQLFTVFCGKHAVPQSRVARPSQGKDVRQIQQLDSWIQSTGWELQQAALESRKGHRTTEPGNAVAACI
eukprot:CAMPEP_0197633814 /NCGR_PEP_ID=MMETSP1338-20131121/10085_1 /TAXON_ID=43686 ORGANISM="Pelagodinium beii, Strain RCC1491" /NCGR_SAMPLE_ID=MMETSP1338 /ASSEMBLY_ACC=CAM_ASM_000754 /LENGTH=130 /DNA_ID=CAMNT_0043205557 /DNA_START=862 /DNA_END=1251 /DNA_ORIENTATION=-